MNTKCEQTDVRPSVGWVDSPVEGDEPSPIRAVPPIDKEHARHASLRLLRSRMTETDFLPRDSFPADLRREKRRAERTKRPLSIVLCRIDDSSDDEDGHDEGQLLELLHETCRETDIIGAVGENMVAVLCPDTDHEGVQGFIRKIQSAADSSWFSCVPATYPDSLFGILADGQVASPDAGDILVSEFDERSGRGYRLKRWLDMIGAVLGIAVSAPLMILVAIAVAATSPGPVIFRQTRLGRHGKPFVFYKFRSMRVDGDDRIHREFVTALIKGGASSQESGRAAVHGLFKLEADPRVTAVGRFIRKTSIDELPQLFNVLKGDMSLVGPRPPIPYEAASYQAWHLRRILSAKPGITGLWQVEGRSKVSFDEMVRMDLRYIRKCSLWLDLKILAKTVLVVLRCDGAT